MKDFDKIVEDAVAAHEAPDSEPAVKVLAIDPVQPVKTDAATKAAADSDFNPDSESAKESSGEEWNPEGTERRTTSSRRNMPAVGLSFLIETVALTSFKDLHLSSVSWDR